MSTIKKLLITLTALAALALGGAAIAGATGVTATDDDADEVVTGQAAERAGAAARDAVGGGTVLSVEADDDGGPVAYEVAVDHAGTITDVDVDGAFAVLGQEVDDDRDDADDADGDDDADDDRDDLDDDDAEDDD